jgi:hypothetical protein
MSTIGKPSPGSNINGQAWSCYCGLLLWRGNCYLKIVQIQSFFTAFIRDYPSHFVMSLLLKWHSAQEIQNKLSTICWGTSESNESLVYTVQNTFLMIDPVIHNMLGVPHLKLAQIHASDTANLLVSCHRTALVMQTVWTRNIAWTMFQ